jgi:hypothetical protein
MMCFMAKKTKKKPTQISFRLKPDELEPLDADRRALPGVPVARNTYARHAVLSYPKLRKLEEIVRESARGAGDDSTEASFLVEAGL